MSNLLPAYARQKLLFAINDAINDTLRSRMRKLIDELATSRQWLIAPPHYVDQIEALGNTATGDLPLETLGGYIEVYSAWPPQKLPKDVDRRCLEDVKTIVEKLSQFSKDTGVEFEFELAGIFVGVIESGKADNSLSQDFIGEWEQRLDMS